MSVTYRDNTLLKFSDGGWTENRDGTAWWQAEPPPRNHEHRWQTRGALAEGPYVERCACGAFNTGDGDWFYMRPDKPRVKEPGATQPLRAARLAP